MIVAFDVDSLYNNLMTCCAFYTQNCFLSMQEKLLMCSSSILAWEDRMGNLIYNKDRNLFEHDVSRYEKDILDRYIDQARIIEL